MSELPRGTVTFLFTDIEGSTRLLRQLGRDHYDDLLAAHREIVEAAVAAHEGRVVETQGDSFFVAFGTAADGVAAAIDVQRDLAAHPWPEGAEFRVRMGLHTGEPKVGAERYVGVGVHKAARIGAAGHGGQVLLSSTTKELAEEELPAGVSIRDLGERRLKDFERPERIFQLVIEGLESEFAQLKTLDVDLRRRRRRMYAGSALIGVLAAAVAIPVFALGQGNPSGGIVAQGNSVAMIDPGTNLVEADIPVGARPDAIAFGAGSLWVSNLDDQTVSQIDPRNPPHLLHSKPLPEAATGIAVTGNAVWTVAGNPGEFSVTVGKIDSQFGTLASVTRLGNVEPGGPGSVAAGRDGVWVAPSAGLLTRLDPHTGRKSKPIDPHSGASALAIGDGAEWIAETDGNTVTRVDPTGLLTPIPVSNGPSALAVDRSGVWVVESLGNAVARIDPSARAQTTTISVGQTPTGIAVGGGSVWVANSRAGTVTRIDEKTARRIKTIDVGGSPQSLTYGDGRIWVTVDDAPRAEAAGGGTARFTEAGQPDFLDPALAYQSDSWQILNATCVKLVRYPDRPGPAGAQLEPEAAKSLPTLSDGGRTYTFRIRRGFRFSPPSHEQVTAQTFKFSIERDLNPKMKGGPGPLLGDVVGAKAYIAGKAAHISGVVARGDTLTIHLVRPAPDLLSRIALPSFCAVPLNTPIDPNGVRTIPAAGPYYVSAYTLGQEAVLLRNPNYSGGRPHHFKRMEIEFGVNSTTADSEIAADKVDYALDGIDGSDRARLQARFGPGSAAAHKDRQQLFTSSAEAVDFLILNTTRGLFRSVRLRRAASLAVDRAALAAGGQWYFGPPPEPVADGYLPPGMPGYTGRPVFPPHGNVGAAKRLAGGTRRTAVMYTCDHSACARIGQIVKIDLARIGITVEVRAFATNEMLALEHRPNTTFDIGLSNWAADYLDPSDFLNLALATPRATGPGYHDPAFEPRLTAAARLSGPRRYLTYGKLARSLARDSAPWIAYGTPSGDSFFSARIGCQINQPLTGVDLAALCLRKR